MAVHRNPAQPALPSLAQHSTAQRSAAQRSAAQRSAALMRLLLALFWFFGWEKYPRVWFYQDTLRTALIAYIGGKTAGGGMQTGLHHRGASAWRASAASSRLCSSMVTHTFAKRRQDERNGPRCCQDRLCQDSLIMKRRILNGQELTSTWLTHRVVRNLIFSPSFPASKPPVPH